MDASQVKRSRNDADSVDESPRPLVPFSGRVIPGVCFSSGYCLWVIDFVSTPTNIGSYREVWVITPDGERILYTDPEAAREIVLQSHDFDQVHGGEITQEQIGSNTTQVTLDGADGTTLELKYSIDQSLGTRVMNLLGTLTPSAVLRTDLGSRISTRSCNFWLDANGTKVAGETEAGADYRLEPDRMFRVLTASASLDGTDLGSQTSPDRRIEFGDIIVAEAPLYFEGEIYLPKPSQEPA